MTRILKLLSRKKKTAQKASTILLGNNVDLNETSLKNFVSIGSNSYLYRCDIESYTYLSSSVTLMNTSIGKFCSIAQGVCIALGEHPSKDFVSTSPVFFSTHKQCGITFADQAYFNEMGKTVIGNDVWIGVNAIIKDNITVGDGAIIGAGAVVTKNVPAYAVVVGNPARILRYRFDEEQIAFLNEFKWWLKDESWLRENFKFLHDIKCFMSKFNL